MIMGYSDDSSVPVPAIFMFVSGIAGRRQQKHLSRFKAGEWVNVQSS